MQSYELQTSRPQSLLLSRPNQRYFISCQTGIAFTFVWVIEGKSFSYVLVSISSGLYDGTLLLGLMTLHARSISDIRLSNDIWLPPSMCEKLQTSVNATGAYDFSALEVLFHMTQECMCVWIILDVDILFYIYHYNNRISNFEYT